MRAILEVKKKTFLIAFTLNRQTFVYKKEL